MILKTCCLLLFLDCHNYLISATCPIIRSIGRQIDFANNLIFQTWFLILHAFLNLHAFFNLHAFSLPNLQS